MTRLSEHFTLEEMTRSATAAQLHIDNTPGTAAIENLTKLCRDILEPLRQHLGMAIHINSGYRSAKLNKAVGGAKYSYHLTGRAADIRITGPAMANVMATYLVQLHDCDLAIYEKKGSAQWLHVQWSISPRHLFLKIFK